MFIPHFNSILVRLKEVIPNERKQLLRNFNSILVRLKGDVLEIEATEITEFQFHIGAIKRMMSSAS